MHRISIHSRRTLRPGFWISLMVPAAAAVGAVALVGFTIWLARGGVKPIELMSVRMTGEMPAALGFMAQQTPQVPLESVTPGATNPEPAIVQANLQAGADTAAFTPAIANVAVQPSNHQPTFDERPMFNGRPIRKVRTLTMLVTAYSPDERSCGRFADGITASGYSVWTNGMRLVAADTRILPFKSIITVPGYNGGQPVPVLDRGGRIKGHRLDVLYATHEQALKFGARRLSVDVWEYAD